MDAKAGTFAVRCVTVVGRFCIVFTVSGRIRFIISVFNPVRFNVAPNPVTADRSSIAFVVINDPSVAHVGTGAAPTRLMRVNPVAPLTLVTVLGIVNVVTFVGNITVLISVFVSDTVVNCVIADRSSVAPVSFVIKALFTHAGNDVALPVRLMRVNLSLRYPVLTVTPVIAFTIAAESVSSGVVFAFAVKVTKLLQSLKKLLPVVVTLVNPLRSTLVNPVQSLKKLSPICVKLVNALSVTLVNPLHLLKKL